MVEFTAFRDTKGNNLGYVVRHGRLKSTDWFSEKLHPNAKQLAMERTLEYLREEMQITKKEMEEALNRFNSLLHENNDSMG